MHSNILICFVVFFKTNGNWLDWELCYTRIQGNSVKSFHLFPCHRGALQLWSRGLAATFLKWPGDEEANLLHSSIGLHGPVLPLWALSMLLSPPSVLQSRRMGFLHNVKLCSVFGEVQRTNNVFKVSSQPPWCCSSQSNFQGTDSSEHHDLQNCIQWEML